MKGRRTAGGGKRRALVLLVLALVIPIAGDKVEAPDILLEQALDAMDSGVHASTDQWRDARTQAASLAGRPRDDTFYRELQRLAQVAGGQHSFVAAPGAGTPGGGSPLPEAAESDGIGLLVLPGFFSWDDAARDSFVQHGQSSLQAADRGVSCGWILDLRDHSGGSPYSIIGAAAPLISDGDVLAFAYPGGRVDRVRIQGNDVLYSDGTGNGEYELVHAGTGTARAAVDKTSRPLAVLQDRSTVSAGESVIIALRGQENVRTFGTRTRGFTTLNHLHQLDDGTVLGISSAWAVDRTGRQYRSGLDPDIAVSGRAYEAAEAWLRSEC